MNDLVCNVPGVSSSDTKQRYNGEQTLPLLLVENQYCEAAISLYGGQVLEFIAKERAPLLWLSPKAVFKKGTAIRGGIPVCLPWFGPHELDMDKPQHGFARNNDWTLKHAEQLNNGTHRIILQFLPGAQQLKLYPYAFNAELELILASDLSLKLTINNLHDSDIAVSWALHSYHPVDNASDTTIEELKNQQYIDNLDNQTKFQPNALKFDQEVDRVFSNVKSQTINCQQAIHITGENCPSIIVWNPGKAKAVDISDLGEENQHKFICVERGAVKSDKWLIAAGKSKTAKVIISSV